MTELEELEKEELDRRAVQARGQRAKLILEDDLFKDAVTGIRDSLWKEFSRVSVRDTEAMREIRIALGLLDKIVSGIELHMREGQIAAHRILEIDKRKGYLKRLMRRVA